MKVTKVRIHKKVTFFSYNLTIVNGEEKISNYNIFSKKTKKAAFEYISTLDCLSGVIASNTHRAIKKLEEMGFTVEADFNYGVLDETCKFFATK